MENSLAESSKHSLRIMIKIYFATMTGNAEGCAIDLDRKLKEKGLTSDSVNLANLSDASALAEAETALVLVSTWGDGEPPDDAIPFFDSLQALPAGALAGTRFAVFALGDSSYDVFCGFGKECDRLLEQLGAVRLLECECCDLDHEKRLPVWADRVGEALATTVTANG